jgi:hypothetical protein
MLQRQIIKWLARYALPVRIPSPANGCMTFYETATVRNPIPRLSGTGAHTKKVFYVPVNMTRPYSPAMRGTA